MIDTLSPEQTAQFRASQKQRSRVILAVIIIWIAAIFGLTVVKGQQAVEQRDAQTTHE